MIFTGTTQRARHRGPNMSSILLRAGPLLAALMLSFAAPAGIGHAAPATAAGGFYLRAGIGLDRPAGTRFTDVDCSSSSPAAVYGCGTGGDGAPYRSVGDFETVVPLEVGLGYGVAPAARLEVLVEYRPRFVFEGRANFLEPTRLQSVAADISSISGMLAAYVDLPGAGLPGFGPFRPFIGAGFGAVRTGRGGGRVVWRDGSREPLSLDLAATRAKLASHGLRLSLRYAF